MSKVNKYLISVDIEGITGVISTNFSNQKGSHYDLARKYMASDVNAVVRGILQADHSAWIAIRDAHGRSAANLDLEKLHPRAHVMQGWGNDVNMVSPLDDTYTGIYLVGYHAGGPNNEAVLGHTYSALVHYVKVNGQLINEAGIAGVYASYFEVPVAFISGDDHAVREGKEQFPDIVGVEVKKSFGRDCALSVSLSEAQTLLESGAKEATVNLLEGKCSLMRHNLPLEIEIKFYNTGYFHSVFRKIYGALGFDQTFRFDLEQFVIRYTAATQLEMFHRLNLLMNLSYGAQNS